MRLLILILFTFSLQLSAVVNCSHYFNGSDSNSDDYKTYSVYLKFIDLMKSDLSQDEYLDLLHNMVATNNFYNLSEKLKASKYIYVQKALESIATRSNPNFESMVREEIKNRISQANKEIVIKQEDVLQEEVVKTADDYIVKVLKLKNEIAGRKGPAPILLRFTSDKKKGFALLSYDIHNVILVFDPLTGEEIKKIPLNRKNIYTFRLTSDDKHLVLANTEDEVFAMDLSTYEEVPFTKDIKISDIDLAFLKRNLDIFFKDKLDKGKAYAISSDEKILAYADSHGKIFMKDLETDKDIVIRAVDGHIYTFWERVKEKFKEKFSTAADAVTISPDKKYILYSLNLTKILILELATGAVREIDLPYAVHLIRFTPDGKYFYMSNANAINFYEFKTGEQVIQLNINSTTSYSLQVFDEKILYWGTYWGEIQKFDFGRWLAFPNSSI